MIFDNFFVGKIERYRRLKESLLQKKGEMVSFCNEQNELIKSKNDELFKAEEAVSKGDSLHVLQADKLKDEILDLSNNYVRATGRLGAEIMRLEKSVEVLEKSDARIKELSKYEVFFEKSAFNSYAIGVVNKHKNKEITTAQLAEFHKGLMKFKDVQIDGKIYKAKDNRRHYADMILVDKNSGKIFLVKRSNEKQFEPGKWALPGGHVEPAENYMMAAIRETLEETGFEISQFHTCECGVYENSDVVIHYYTALFDPETIPLLEGRELVNCDWRSIAEIFQSDDLIANLRENFENGTIRI